MNQAPLSYQPPLIVVPAITVLSIRRAYTGGSLRGFCKIHIAKWRLQLSDCPFHQTANGRRWCGPPGRPLINKDGMALRDEKTGRVTYQVIFIFDDNETFTRFSNACIDALLHYDASAFDIRRADDHALAGLPAGGHP